MDEVLGPDCAAWRESPGTKEVGGQDPSLGRSSSIKVSYSIVKLCSGIAVGIDLWLVLGARVRCCAGVRVRYVYYGYGNTEKTEWMV